MLLVPLLALSKARRAIASTNDGAIYFKILTLRSDLLLLLVIDGALF